MDTQTAAQDPAVLREHGPLLFTRKTRTFGVLPDDLLPAELFAETGADAEAAAPDWAFRTLPPARMMAAWLDWHPLDAVLISGRPLSSEQRAALRRVQALGVPVWMHSDLALHGAFLPPTRPVPVGPEDRVFDRRLRGQRALDLTFLALAAPLLGLLVVLVALLLLPGRTGPLLRGERRAGLHGRPYIAYHFAASEGAPGLKGAGLFLRRTRLDRLPQLLNVLRGEMSLVGPRAVCFPLATAFEQDVPGYALRYRVRPGCTGWDQVQSLALSAEAGDSALHRSLPLLVQDDTHVLSALSPWFTVRLLCASAGEMLAAGRRENRPVRS